MPKTIAIVNQKGGVGKTTTVINLAAGLSLLGKKILILDLDPQGNSTSGFGIDKSLITKSIYNVLLNEIDLKESFKTIELKENKKLTLSPSVGDLSGADIELSGIEDREWILRKAIIDNVGGYDFILIDCPPSLSLLTINAFTAADSLLIPVQCEFFAMEGLAQLNKTIELIINRLNPSLEIEGLLLTMYDTRNNICKTVASEVKEFFKDKPYGFVEEPTNSQSNYWLNSIILQDKDERDLFLHETNSQGVTTRPIWTLMNKLNMFKGFQCDELSNAEWLEQRVVNIPSSVLIK